LLNSCCDLVQYLLCRNVNIKIRRIIILPVALYGCGTCVLTPREGHRLRVLENRVLKRMFGPERRKSQEAGEDCIMRSFILHTLQQILLG